MRRQLVFYDGDAYDVMMHLHCSDRVQRVLTDRSVRRQTPLSADGVECSRAGGERLGHLCPVWTSGAAIRAPVGSGRGQRARHVRRDGSGLRTSASWKGSWFALEEVSGAVPCGGAGPGSQRRPCSAGALEGCGLCPSVRARRQLESAGPS
jgi:hypothetical protein